MDYSNPLLIRTLKEGLVAVMPTDTIYGIVGKASDENTVSRIYKIRKRAPEKPCIILIGNPDELRMFGVAPSEKQIEEIKKHWSFDLAQDKPRPTSIIFDCPEEKFKYLHRGTKTLAFRLPASEALRNLIVETGPLLAPSANPEGLPPARAIEEAQKYFGDKVDFYVDGGLIEGRPSKVIKLHDDGTLTIIRE